MDTKKKGSFIEKLAAFIVDKRNLFSCCIFLHLYFVFSP